jgi:hypothetical protein
MAEIDDLRERVTFLEHERRNHDAVVTELGNYSIREPQRAYRMIRDGIEYTASGQPKNVRDLVGGLYNEIPELFAGRPMLENGSADGGAQGTPMKTPFDMNQAIRDRVMDRRSL